jgi:hypothetical protein
MDSGVSPETDPQKVIEADEMVHMGVGKKNMADPEDLSRRKPVEFAEIEKDCFFSVL